MSFEEFAWTCRKIDLLQCNVPTYLLNKHEYLAISLNTSSIQCDHFFRYVVLDTEFILHIGHDKRSVCFLFQIIIKKAINLPYWIQSIQINLNALHSMKNKLKCLKSNIVARLILIQVLSLAIKCSAFNSI